MSRYLQVMASEGLEISQPALDPDQSSEIHHRITVRDRKAKVHRYIMAFSNSFFFGHLTFIFDISCFNSSSFILLLLKASIWFSWKFELLRWKQRTSLHWVKVSALVSTDLQIMCWLSLLSFFMAAYILCLCLFPLKTYMISSASSPFFFPFYSGDPIKTPNRAYLVMLF